MLKSSSETRKNCLDEPLWWFLFSAGGLCFAICLPPLILLLLGKAAGLIDPQALAFERVHAKVFSWKGILLVGAVVILPLFHAAHRIRHGLHDLKLSHGPLPKWLSYGLAALLSLLALGLRL